MLTQSHCPLFPLIYWLESVRSYVVYTGSGARPSKRWCLWRNKRGWRTLTCHGTTWIELPLVSSRGRLWVLFTVTGFMYTMVFRCTTYSTKPFRGGVTHSGENDLKLNAGKSSPFLSFFDIYVRSIYLIVPANNAHKSVLRSPQTGYPRP